jgi:hypothetical protein
MPSKEFDDWAVARVGLPFEPLSDGTFEDQIVYVANQRFQIYAAQASNEICVAIEVGVVMGDDFNAIATKHSPARYFIAIRRGRLTPLISAVKSSYGFSSEKDKGFPDVFKDSVSADREMMALENLIFQHELTHIAGGHVDFGESLSPEQRLALRPIDFQMLELDADSAAIKFAILSLTGIKQHRGDHGPIFSVDRDTDEGEFRRAAEQAGSIVYTNFRVIERVLGADPETDQVTARKHPPFLVRLYGAVGLVGTIAMGLSEPYRTRLLEGFAQGVVSRELVLAPYYGEGLRRDLVLGGSEKTHRYAGHLIKHWHSLRPRLEPFALGGRLAPTQEWRELSEVLASLGRDQGSL